jgi:hypothetical protein
MVIVVTRKHCIVFGILLVIQVPAFALMISHFPMHIPAFFWPAILGCVASSSFITALILVRFAAVLSQQKGSLGEKP